MSQASLDKTTPKFKEPTQQNQNKPPELDSAKKQNVPSMNIFQTAEEKPRVDNIFADAPTQPQRVNIFANDEKSRKTGNIFDKNEGNKSINLFACSKVPQTSTNIFNSSKKPLVKTQKDDDQDNFEDKSSSNASSGQIQKQQKQFKTIPEKLIMKFKYENPFEVVKKYDIKKFKNGQNPSKENVVLTFEKPKGETGGNVNVIVRAKQTKVLLFQGQFLKELTAKVQNFMNREDNVKFWVVKHVAETQKQATKWVKEELKLQLASIQDAKDLKQFMQKEFTQKQTNKNKPQTII